MVYRWHSLPRVHRYRASGPQGSSSNGRCLAGHDNPVNMCLSFPTQTNGMMWACSKYVSMYACMVIAGRAVWVPPTPFDDGYDVCGPKATRVGKESARATVPVLHRPAKGIRLSRPHTTLASARSLRNTTADDRSDPPIPRWDESMRAKR